MSLFKQALDNEGTVDVFRTISCLVIVMNIPSVLCFNGDMVSTEFEIHKTFDDCGWYEFPLNMKKRLPMMLMMMQKPVFIQGYMNTQCTCEAFKTVTIFFENFLTVFIHI